jgi:hypothetical protein
MYMGPYLDKQALLQLFSFQLFDFFSFKIMSTFILELNKCLILLKLLPPAQNHQLTWPRNVTQVPVNCPTVSVPEMAHTFQVTLIQKMYVAKHVLTSVTVKINGLYIPLSTNIKTYSSKPKS